MLRHRAWPRDKRRAGTRGQEHHLLTLRLRACIVVVAMPLTLSGCSPLSDVWDFIAGLFSPTEERRTEEVAVLRNEGTPPTADVEVPSATDALALEPSAGAPEVEEPGPVPDEPETHAAATLGFVVSSRPEPEAVSDNPPEPEPANPAPLEPGQQTATATIQLAAVPSQRSAVALWERLQQSFPSLLGDRQLEIQRADLGERGKLYRVRTSRYGDPSRADSVCAQLKAHGQDCLVYLDATGKLARQDPELSDQQRRELFERFLRWQQKGEGEPQPPGGG
jgi:hypothetical protein